MCYYLFSVCKYGERKKHVIWINLECVFRSVDQVHCRCTSPAVSRTYVSSTCAIRPGPRLLVTTSCPGPSRPSLYRRAPPLHTLPLLLHPHVSLQLSLVFYCQLLRGSLNDVLCIYFHLKTMVKAKNVG